jgi:hypothetical protein
MSIEDEKDHAAAESDEEEYDEEEYDEDDEDDDGAEDDDDPTAEGEMLAEDLQGVQTWLKEWEGLHQMTLDEASEALGERLPDWARTELGEAWGALDAGINRLGAVVSKMLDVLSEQADEEGWAMPQPERPPGTWSALDDYDEDEDEDEPK